MIAVADETEVKVKMIVPESIEPAEALAALTDLAAAGLVGGDGVRVVAMPSGDPVLALAMAVVRLLVLPFQFVDALFGLAGTVREKFQRARAES